MVNSDNEQDSILLMLIKGSEAQSGMVRFEIHTQHTAVITAGFITEQLWCLNCPMADPSNSNLLIDIQTQT